MAIKVTVEEAERIIRARNLKQRIDELEREIKGLEAEKAELEEEYEKLGVEIK